MLTKNNQIISPVAFIEKYNFSEIKSIEDFKKFDSELQANEEFAKDFKDTLEHLLGSNIKQSIVGIIKKFLHRDFAIKCTAIKFSPNKFVLKNTCFYNSLFDLICHYHKTSEGGIVTEKIFYKSLSSCLTNAKDWDRFRKLRQPAATE
ncbi:uncharacterized protein LOC105204350 [Solenopsis invicta]|uniref:uncharacterized protein LOC105204350 n=1 Tax=Solenopsis invicta TaxID=13686 RepID=UPI00193E69F8|nr:uncharacterized protein LOC105204350 [Solenopsis invicta]